MISVRRIVGPTVEPVTLEQAKQQCRVQGDEDSDLLVTLIQAAREYAEKQTNRSFLEQTWRLSRDRFPGVGILSGLSGFGLMDFGLFSGLGRHGILLPRPNLIAVASITYLDGNGERQTLDPSRYLADPDSEPGRVTPAPGSSWPATIWGHADAVQVTYTAGYGDQAADVPASIQLAILGLVAHWYENRESTVLTNSPNASTVVPQFVDSLLMSEEAPTVFDYEAG